MVKDVGYQTVLNKVVGHIGGFSEKIAEYTGLLAQEKKVYQQLHERAARVMEQVDKAFRSAGFRTSRNLPFAGAYVVQTYGKPVLGHHAIQIEIDRSLYMNETTIETRPDFEEFRRVLNRIIAQLAEICRADLRVAAE